MKHVGGGWYELSDGSKVQGKDAAKKAQDKLDEIRVPPFDVEHEAVELPHLTEAPPTCDSCGSQKLYKIHGRQKTYKCRVCGWLS